MRRPCLSHSVLPARRPPPRSVCAELDQQPAIAVRKQLWMALEPLDQLVAKQPPVEGLEPDQSKSDAQGTWSAVRFARGKIVEEWTVRRRRPAPAGRRDPGTGIARSQAERAGVALAATEVGASCGALG